MKVLSSGFRRLAAAIILALSAGGCSTVIKSERAVVDKGGEADRAALRAAAANVADAPWPKPTSSSLAERLAGAEPEGDKLSRDDAVAAYVETLSETPDAENRLMADADRHILAARALNEVAKAACESAAPQMADVALLEDAIADLRETRAIYVASLKEIDGDKLNIELVKRSFDDVIKTLGDVADDLANNAVKKNSRNLAGPQTLAGSI
ncbi:MAG: hypothetical protein HXY21_06195 [Parvularculaceae bacterium]|nr:hypothetical protein [Parvularculaceae bacterium]